MRRVAALADCSSVALQQALAEGLHVTNLPQLILILNSPQPLNKSIFTLYRAVCIWDDVIS